MFNMPWTARLTDNEVLKRMKKEPEMMYSSKRRKLAHPWTSNEESIPTLLTTINIQAPYCNP